MCALYLQLKQRALGVEEVDDRCPAVGLGPHRAAHRLIHDVRLRSANRCSRKVAHLLTH